MNKEELEKRLLGKAAKIKEHSAKTGQLAHTQMLVNNLEGLKQKIKELQSNKNLHKILESFRGMAIPIYEHDAPGEKHPYVVSIMFNQMRYRGDLVPSIDVFVECKDALATRRKISPDASTKRNNKPLREFCARCPEVTPELFEERLYTGIEEFMDNYGKED